MDGPSLLIITSLLLAHEWYPSKCCSEADCREVPCSQIRKVGDGYQYTRGADQFNFSAAQHAYSPDGLCHACIGAGRARCIFTPLPAAT